MFCEIIFISAGNALTETKEIQLPDNVIEGSARGTVSVLGKATHSLKL